MNVFDTNFFIKFFQFTCYVFRVVVKWKTKNIRSLLRLKDKNGYKLYIIYTGDCSCGSSYIGETKCKKMK